LAFVRTLLRWVGAGREVFDQELLKEKMLEYLPMDHFLDLGAAVATSEIQTSANDPDACR
jgi:hypothetical protein